MSVSNIKTRNVMATKRVVDYPSSYYVKHQNGLIKSASTSSCSANESNLFKTLRTNSRSASNNNKKHGYSETEKTAIFNERLKLFVLQPFSYSEQNMPLLVTDSSDSLPEAEKIFYYGSNICYKSMFGNALHHFKECGTVSRTSSASPPVTKTETANGWPHLEFSSHRNLDNLLISKENNSSIINFTAVNDQHGCDNRSTGISNNSSNSWPSMKSMVSSGESSQEIKNTPKILKHGSNVQPHSSSAPPVPVSSSPLASTPLSTLAPPVSMPLSSSKQAPTLTPPPPSYSTPSAQLTEAKDNDPSNNTNPEIGPTSTQCTPTQSDPNAAGSTNANTNSCKNNCSTLLGTNGDSNSTTNEVAEGRVAPKKEEKNFRRSSSLKIPKHESTTNPAQKKIVRFADAMGLDLTDVRTFLDEMPSVPKSAYTDLCSSGVDDTNNAVVDRLFGITAPQKPTLVPMFKQPGISLNFLERIRDHFVCLEKALVTMQPVCSITGTVRVRNIDFHKSVYVRYTLDHWLSFSEVPAIYVPDSCDGFSDQFSFIVYLYEVPKSHRVELAIRYHCSGSIFWDNNFCANYVFQSLSSPPTMPSYFTCMQTSSDRCQSFY